MLENIINESGMDFITENSFYIEKSAQYESVQENIRSVEFVRVKDDKLIFVEAKTTFPNPENDNQRYDEEISEICEKFIHSINLYSSIEVGVADEGFPEDFKPNENMSLVFLLVIKNHKPEWCRPINKKIMSVLPSYLKTIWKPSVFVINHKTAINRQMAFH